MRSSLSEVVSLSVTKVVAHNLKTPFQLSGQTSLSLTSIPSIQTTYTGCQLIHCTTFQPYSFSCVDSKRHCQTFRRHCKLLPEQHAEKLFYRQVNMSLNAKQTQIYNFSCTMHGEHYLVGLGSCN